MRIFFAVWLRYRARGLEHIPPEGGGLILSNHQSFLDPLLIGLPLSRPVSYLARDSLFRVPVIGWMLRHTYVMPINRDAVGTAGLKETLRRMEMGYLIGVFPEGTRSADGEVHEFKPGFIALVRRLKLPIYPVGVAGADHALGRGSWFLKPYTVRIVFGEPIPPEQIAELTGKGREQELVEAVRQRVIACQQEARSWLEGKLEVRSQKSEVRK
jgi:1-acyl-sn-glycerol-3-phosphate acyltransferase